MNKDELFQELILKLENEFQEETPAIIPSEEKTAFTKQQCELFTRRFPEFVPGHYKPVEPAGADLATRTHFWLKNLVVLVSQAIIHEDLREKVYATPDLEPFANLLRNSAALRESEEG